MRTLFKMFASTTTPNILSVQEVTPLLEFGDADVIFCLTLYYFNL
jgi:hypothetical protein